MIRFHSIKGSDGRCEDNDQENESNSDEDNDDDDNSFDWEFEQQLTLPHQVIFNYDFLLSVFNMHCHVEDENKILDKINK